MPIYLCFYLNSLAAKHIEAGSVGVALTHFNTRSVATMPLPLPPLAEQQRIVAKVDELMALCDHLEEQLEASSATQAGLLESTLRDVLSSRDPKPTGHDGRPRASGPSPWNRRRLEEPADEVAGIDRH